MSADNYTECPKCQIEINLKDAYGRVTKEEYEELLKKKVERPWLREDWEIGFHGGKFSVRYSATCRNEKCGWTWRFTHEEVPFV